MIVDPPIGRIPRMRREDATGKEDDCRSEQAGMTGELCEPGERATQDQLLRLSRTIEGEIIPRLMMLFDADIAEARQQRSNHAPPDRELDVTEFADLLLHHDADVASAYVTDILNSGVALEAVYLDLLAPAARHLGALWENDSCSFTAVTIGVSRMHQVLMQFSPCFCAGRPDDAESGDSALILPMPGEQHTFGLFMVIEFFRRDGWNVWGGSPRRLSDILEMVDGNHFDVVGLSVSAERNLDELPDKIRQIREQSRNGGVKILVGGSLFTHQPELYRSVGADASAASGEEAVKIARALVHPA